MTLIFSVSGISQIYEMPMRDNPHHEIEILMSFNYLTLFKAKKHTEDYHIRKPDDENVLFETENEKCICVGEKFKTFGKKDSSSDHGFNDVKFPFAYGEENFYFMLDQKFFPIQNYNSSTEKNECDYLYKKDDELEGDNITDENDFDIIEHCKDFINCKIVYDRDST